MAVTVRKSRIRAVLLLGLLFFAGVVFGFFVGAILANKVAKRKETPEFWRKAAHEQFARLHLSPEQRKKADERTEAAIKELAELRIQSIQRVWDVVERAVEDIDKEMTPEQRAAFEKVKPKKPAELKNLLPPGSPRVSAPGSVNHQPN